MRSLQMVILSLIFSQILLSNSLSTLEGIVTDDSTHAAIEGIHVRLKELDKDLFTNADGYFQFKDIPAGKYTLEAWGSGYCTMIIQGVKIHESEVIKLNLELKLCPGMDMKYTSEFKKFRVETKSKDIVSDSRIRKSDYYYESGKIENDEEDKVLPDISGSAASKEVVIITDSDSPEELPIHAAKSPKPLPLVRFKATESSGLKAGFADDNEQFNYFVNFLEEYKERAKHYPISIRERLHFSIRDEQEKSLPNTKVQVFHKKKLLVEGNTFADGSFLFFPSEFGKKIQKYRMKIFQKDYEKEITFNRDGPRHMPIQIETQKTNPEKLKVDILFILDTTGSMSEEINRLKKTIDLININLVSLQSGPRVRFGLDLYKDKNDDYTTQLIPFTEDLELFQEALATIEAGGGGDTPEDLQSALDDAIHKFEWNEDGIRLAFIITDAPAHLDYDQKYTYVDAAHDAKKMGIKVFSIGTGGLDISGEYVLRQISQYTSARYIFLTYGEKGESEGGKTGSVSHHTGDNYQTDKLEAIIIRIAKEEISAYLDLPVEASDDYFTARQHDEETKEMTLNKLFTMALSQLLDYSTIKIEQNTATCLLPISTQDTTLTLTAEYFGQSFLLATNENKTLKIIERNDLQNILDEHKLIMTGLIEPSKAAQIGQLIGAELMLFGDLFKKTGYYELFLKLVRVETGEILGVTKMQVDHFFGI